MNENNEQKVISVSYGIRGAVIALASIGHLNDHKELFALLGKVLIAEFIMETVYRIFVKIRK